MHVLTMCPSHLSEYKIWILWKSTIKSFLKSFKMVRHQKIFYILSGFQSLPITSPQLLILIILCIFYLLLLVDPILWKWIFMPDFPNKSWKSSEQALSESYYSLVSLLLPQHRSPFILHKSMLLQKFTLLFTGVCQGHFIIKDSFYMGNLYEISMSLTSHIVTVKRASRAVGLITALSMGNIPVLP